MGTGPCPSSAGDATGGWSRWHTGWQHRLEERKERQEPLVLVISPSNNAVLAHIFFIPVEGTVSADDLCHTPVLSGM